MLHEYVDLGYKPSSEEIVCEYYIEPIKGISLEKAATHLAGESSIDTWSDILTLSPALAKKLKPHIFFIDKNKNTIKVAYHTDLFEINSVPQLLSSIAGNILSMEMLENVRLQDVSLPKQIIKQFKGPKFGVYGIRNLLGIKKRPLIGTIVKPKVGLTSEKHAEVAYNSWIGGCDLVKEDENLTNQKFNPFERRVNLTLKLREKAERETGERKMYLPNITAATCEEILKRAKFVKNAGGEYAMIDIIPVGWTALQTLREANEDLKLVLHAHRCMHSALTRNPKHGISMIVISKLTRLIGMDQLHVGTVLGKMHGSREEVLAVRDECVSKNVKENYKLNILDQDWHHIKPLFPVASGGLHPAMIPELIKIFGKDIIMQFGGGIHAHPKGTKSGAMACRQALDAVINNISIKEEAKKHIELKEAMDKWG